MKHIKLMKQENEILFNEAKAKFVNDDINRKVSDELIIKEALKKYLGVE